MKSPNLPKAASSRGGFPLLDRFSDQQCKVMLDGLIAFFLLAASLAKLEVVE